MLVIDHESFAFVVVGRVWLCQAALVCVVWEEQSESGLLGVEKEFFERTGRRGDRPSERVVIESRGAGWRGLQRRREKETKPKHAGVSREKGRWVDD